MTARILKRLLLISLWGALCVYSARALSGLWSMSSDDAAITFAYAQNLVEGHGLVHSVGAEPVEGFSNPSWLATLGLFYALGFSELTELSKLLSCLALLLTALLMWRLPSRLQERGPIWSDLVAPAWILGSPVSLIWASSGLENALFGCLITLSLWFEASPAPRPRRLSLCALFMVLVIWSRPEGVGYAVVMGLCLCLSELKRGEGLSELLKRYGLIVLGGLLLLLGARYGYFEQWLPNTYYAKVGGARELKPWYQLGSPGLSYVSSYFKRFELWWQLIPLSLLLLDRRRLRYVPLLGALAFSLFFPIYVGGDWMGSWRFLTPTIALSAPLLAMGAQRAGELSAALLGWRGAERLGAWSAQITPIILALTALSLVTSARQRMIKQRPPPGWKLEENARAGLAFSRLRQALGLERASLLIADVGAPSLRPDLLIHDLGELCSRPLSRIKGAQAAQDFAIAELRPDMMTFAASWRGHRAVKGSREIKEGYLELPRSAEFPLWPWGYAGLRRDLIVDELAELSHPVRRRWAGLELLGVKGLPRALPRGALIQVTLLAQRRQPLPKDMSLKLLARELRPSTEPTPAQSFELIEGEGIYPLKSWAYGDIVPLTAQLRLSEPGLIELALSHGEGSPPLSLGRFEVSERPALSMGREALSEVQEAIKQGELRGAERALRVLDAWVPRRALPPFDQTFSKKFLAPKERKTRSKRANQRLRSAYTKRLAPKRDDEPWVATLRAEMSEARWMLAERYCERAALALSEGALEAAWARLRQGRRHSAQLRCGFEAALSEALGAQARQRRAPLQQLLGLTTALKVDPSQVSLRAEAEAIRLSIPKQMKRQPMTRALREARLSSRQLAHQPRPQRALRAFKAWRRLGQHELIASYCDARGADSCDDELSEQAQLAACLVWGAEGSCRAD